MADGCPCAQEEEKEEQDQGKENGVRGPLFASALLSHGWRKILANPGRISVVAAYMIERNMCRHRF